MHIVPDILRGLYTPARKEHLPFKAERLIPLETLEVVKDEARSRVRAADELAQVKRQRAAGFLTDQGVMKSLKDTIAACPWIDEETLRDLFDTCLEHTRDSLGRIELLDNIQERIRQGH